jgi:hypothetical protein
MAINRYYVGAVGEDAVRWDAGKNGHVVMYAEILAALEPVTEINMRAAFEAVHRAKKPISLHAGGGYADLTTEEHYIHFEHGYRAAEDAMRKRVMGEETEHGPHAP